MELPRTVANEAAAIVAAFFSLRQSPTYQAFVGERLRLGDQLSGSSARERSGSFDAGNFSALMCFDFHWVPGDGLKLIEINTNASMGLIADLLYQTHGLANPFAASFRDEIYQTFLREYHDSAFGQGGNEPNGIAIVDADPAGQRLFAEFLLYQELFESRGHRCQIVDPRDLCADPTGSGLAVAGNGTTEKIDLIYNRDTDFYFERPEIRLLREKWMGGQVCVSPNPREYALLADKERLQDLTTVIGESGDGTELAERFQLDALHAKNIAGALLCSTDVNSADPQDLWARRKNLFFKPKRSYGGKATYRGSSVSRNVFEQQVLKGEYIAQEFAPPPTVDLTASPDNPGGKFKFDLRFFTYRDRIQLAVARLYQGQTTNFQSPGGGIAALKITDGTAEITPTSLN